MTFSNRQQQIINLAIELIAENGIQNLTTNNLAKRLELSEAAIYRHFKSKLDILLSILALFEKNSRTQFEEILKEDILQLEKVKKIFIARCQDFSLTPQLACVIFSEEIFRNEPELSKKVDEIMMMHQNHLIQIINSAIENREIRADIQAENLCIVIMGALRLIVTRWRMMNYEFDLVKKAENVWESINLMMMKEV
jgi:AcrR family transcriptional regulator